MRDPVAGLYPGKLEKRSRPLYLEYMDRKEMDTPIVEREKVTQAR